MFVTLNEHSAHLAVVQIGRTHLRLADQAALLITGKMGLVTEIALAMLAGEARIRVALRHLALVRLGNGCRDDGGFIPLATHDLNAVRRHLPV